MQRRAIAFDWRLQRKIATRAENGDTVVAENAVDDNGVARLRPVSTEVDIGADRSDSGRNNEHLIAGALVHDLGVAGDDRYARLACRFSHGAGDLAQQVKRHALLDNGGTRQVTRHRTADGKIVDGSADGELTDVPSGEDQGVNDKCVGGEGQTVALS